MRKRRILPIVVIWLLGQGLGGARQATPHAAQAPQPPQQAPPSIFKSDVVIARIDVEAIDQHGRPVTDLTERDFAVYENGKRQELRTFSRQEIKAEPPVANAAPVLVRGGDADPVAPRTRRIFLVVLGFGANGRIQGPAKAYDGAASFIREKLLPQDFVSVMSYDRATDFTTNHEAAARVVDELKRRHESLAFKIHEYFIDPAHRGDDLSPAIQADIDAAFVPPGGSDLRVRSATDMLLGTAVFRRNDDRPWQRAWNGMVVHSDLLKIDAGIEYLRYLDGEKHLICLTSGDVFLDGLPGSIMSSGPPNGLRMNSAQDAVRLAARANDARVALDIIHTTGIPTGANIPHTGVPHGGGNQDVISSSEDVAEFTGGFFTGVNYASVALAHIDQATRFGYILGYAPSNPAVDGKYRNVTVKVSRPGVTARFRHGYTAGVDRAVADPKEAMANARLLAAETTDLDEHDITVHAKATATVAKDGAKQVRFEIVIDAARLSLTKSGDRHVGAIDLDILCGDAKQQLIGSLKQKMEMSLDEDHYQRALKDGIPYTVVVPVTGFADRARVLVYDYGSDLLGSANVAVK